MRAFVLAALLAIVPTAPAQTADQAWLRYIDPHSAAPVVIPRTIRALGHGAVEQSAARELQRGFTGLTGSPFQVGGDAARGEVVLGTTQEFQAAYPGLALPSGLGPESYSIGWSALGPNGLSPIVVGADESGVLYGAFNLLRSGFAGLNLHSHPAFSIRWVDNWDNPDGSIERGYAGRSIFFEDGNVRSDLAPVAEYARLLASVGINGCNINNVNAAPQLLNSDHLKQIARIADTMRPWGVHIAMSVAIASPQTIGGLPTYDPLDPAVKAWWAAKVAEIYSLIPDFAGFTVKADSEGQPGPASYGRTPADAANLLAAALAPHGGVVLYRAFVYNHHADWRDPKADRARAAYDIFAPLDRKFARNVIVQTKEGPIDFQAQEPVSPLFAALRGTSQALEVEITQEYTGQQRHLVYLAPMWKQVLDFDMHENGAQTPVKTIIAGGLWAREQESKVGQSPPLPLGGMVGVAGIGQQAWLGSPLALANLYAFGRLAWDPNLTPEEIAEEWTKQTLGLDPMVVATVDKMLMQSWPAYVHYTGPLGTQTLTDITGSHYGPNIESSERNGWGQWHNADAQGIGMDRTVATGTGFTGQYPPEVAKVYEDLTTTSDDLLLFFHHVPYTYKLHDGKTVIQYIYDSHYAGASQAANLVTEWASLNSRIDPGLYHDVLGRLQYQAGHSIVWRDAIVQYFLKLSSIPDDRLNQDARAGHYPGRLEAEDARLTGYQVIDIKPWEDASGGKAVSCEGQPSCSAEWTYAGKPGRFNIAIQYFDLQGGAAHFKLSVNGQPVATWLADAMLPSRRPNGDNSTRYTAPAVDLKPGDILRVDGTPDASDPAALDYIEITPAGPTP